VETLNAKLLYYFQVSYDYLLDRWNIPVGLVLQISLISAWGMNVLREGHSTFTLIFTLILLAQHELVHVRFQRLGWHLRLNAIAQRWAPRWLLRQALLMSIATVMLLVTWDDTRKMLMGLIEFSAWVVWYHAWGLQVRDRDDARFRRFSTASLDTGTGVS
jgi:hypothetical protein